MTKPKEDRRIRITKQAIRESLVELMQQYPLTKISVKMICETADINRSTFYAHYTDQYDLLKKMQQDVMSGFADQIFSQKFIEGSEQTVSVLAQILEYAKANAPLFQVLLSEDGDLTFQNYLVQLVQQKTLEEIREDKRLDPSISKYLETFAISGYVSLIRKWLEEGCVDEPGPLAELMTKLLFQGIIGVYSS